MEQGNIVTVSGLLFRHRKFVVIACIPETHRICVIDIADNSFIANILENQISAVLSKIDANTIGTMTKKVRKLLDANGFEIGNGKAELIRKVKQGDKQARVEFFKLYKKKIWN